LHLFHRVDSEFDDGTWRTILDQFSGMQVLFAMTEVLGWRTLLREAQLALQRAPVAGWVRNRGAFGRCVPGHFSITPTAVGDLPGFLLAPGPQTR